MASFDWDTLLDYIIQDRSVVPVIGQELRGPSDESFGALLAARVAEEFALPERSADLRHMLSLAPKQQIPMEDLARKVTMAHRDLLPTVNIPEALAAVAAITGFSLFLSTTVDGLLVRALRDARGADVIVKTAMIESFEDAPTDAAPPATIVYHLFGRLRGLSDFAMTEGDVLEFDHRLHDRELRPQRLFKRLRESHLLLIGQSFPDWLARVFLRLLRDRPVAARGSVCSAMADSFVHAEYDHSLVIFLRDFAPQTMLYTEGDGAEFAIELHRRWTERCTTTEIVAPTTAVMKAGAVFISYTHADLAAAEAITASLLAAGLDVWFDRTGLQIGDAYAQVIRRNIRPCDLFLPLISSATEQRANSDAFFRREWEWALARAEGPGSRFICPIVIDEHVPAIYGLRGIPDEFRDLYIVRASGGILPTYVVENLVANVRELRSQRMRVH
jgi:TIR domain/SIR2-like domain